MAEDGGEGGGGVGGGGGRGGAGGGGGGGGRGEEGGSKKGGPELTNPRSSLDVQFVVPSITSGKGRVLTKGQVGRRGEGGGEEDRFEQKTIMKPSADLPRIAIVIAGLCGAPSKRVGVDHTNRSEESTEKR